MGVHPSSFFSESWNRYASDEASVASLRTTVTSVQGVSIKDTEIVEASPEMQFELDLSKEGEENMEEEAEGVREEEERVAVIFPPRLTQPWTTIDLDEFIDNSPPSLIVRSPIKSQLQISFTLGKVRCS